MRDHQTPKESTNAKEVKYALEEEWNNEQQNPSRAQSSQQAEEGKEANSQTETTTEMRNDNAITMDDNALLDELERVKAERDEYLNDLKRLQAEFNNFRKRSEKERSEMREYLMQDFIMRILGVLENLERAVHPDMQTEDMESYRSGVEMVYKQLMDILSENGLTKIHCQGEPFDPNLHEAVMEVESEEHDPGTVVAELTPGYQLKDRVLKAPKVQIAKAKTNEAQNSENQNSGSE